jgi:DNA-directed RNA polymerase beta subunit
MSYAALQKKTEKQRIEIIQSTCILNGHFNPYAHIIKSYNVFLANLLEITTKLPDTLKEPNGVRLNSISVKRPCHMENRVETYTDPHFCILAKTTYKSELIGYFSINKGTAEIPEIVDICIPIGYIPIMVGSDACNAIHTKYDKIKESPQLRHGGYFIINGNIRYMVPQFSAIVNSVIVLYNNKIKNYIAHIRSQSSGTGHSVATEFIIVNNNDIVVKTTFFTTPIPLGVILSALEYTEEELLNVFQNLATTFPTKVYVDSVIAQMIMHSSESAKELLTSKLVEKYKTQKD